MVWISFTVTAVKGGEATAQRHKVVRRDLASGQPAESVVACHISTLYYVDSEQSRRKVTEGVRLLRARGYFEKAAADAARP